MDYILERICKIVVSDEATTPIDTDWLMALMAAGQGLNATQAIALEGRLAEAVLASVAPGLFRSIQLDNG